MDNFFYFPDSHAVVNLSLVTMVCFSGAAGAPACILHFGSGSASLELRGDDIARLMKILHIDLQAVQVDLQRTRSVDSQGQQDSG